MTPELRAVLGQAFTFQGAVSNPLVQLGFAEPKDVAFSRQRRAGNFPETCPLAQRLNVHPDIFSSLGGGEQLFRFRFNRRKVINCDLKGDHKSGPVDFNRLHTYLERRGRFWTT
jgi:hypothetical protein